MLQGAVRIGHAQRTVDSGVRAISASNRDGNKLDGAPALIRALPAIADAVGDQAEVLVDGGIRRGSDVVKGLALGAHAVMIARVSLWCLAANGQAGIENVRAFSRDGIHTASVLTSVAEVGRRRPRPQHVLARLARSRPRYEQH